MRGIRVHNRLDSWLARPYFAVQSVLSRPISYQRGQGLVEYALIIALVAIVVIAALVLLGPRIASIFNRVNSSL
jgi:pilus assembly protein Flp/PilA